MVGLGNSSLPDARLLWQQAGAVLAKAVAAYLEFVGKPADLELTAAMMDG